MSRTLPLVCLLLLLSACSDGHSNPHTNKPHIVVQESEINKVVIEDFNWEPGLTKTYTINQTGVTITDDSKQPINKQVTFTPDQAKEVWRLINAIETIYVGRFRDDEMADGVFVTFHFHMNNHIALTTSVNNIRIDSYAKLTQYISEMIAPGQPFDQYAIHYHQYDYTKPIEDIQ